MAEFLIGLFALAIVGTLFAVLGHGLWLVAAGILRAVFRIGGDASRATSHCTRCGHAAGLQHGVCVYCGFETVAARRRGLKSAMRQIQQLKQQGRLDPVVV